VKKYKRHLLLSTLILFSGCQNKKEISISGLEKIGYKPIYCDKVDYYDSKSDAGEDPFFKIYSQLEIDNPKLSILAARCFNENYCMYELINNNEIVCQKYFVHNKGEFFKMWDEHKVLVFNTKKIVN
tara:strand:- start:434 stop:814 length:381 start_codon:yes stop_codon:yes gene_type:complete